MGKKTQAKRIENFTFFYGKFVQLLSIRSLFNCFLDGDSLSYEKVLFCFLKDIVQLWLGFCSGVQQILFLQTKCSNLLPSIRSPGLLKLFKVLEV